MFKCFIFSSYVWFKGQIEAHEVRVCVFVRCSDIQRVLREDSEKMRLLQQNQPRFSEDQKKELSEVHPWIKKGGLPKAIDVKVEQNSPFRTTHAAPPIISLI